jgi:hypothetical protein
MRNKSNHREHRGTRGTTQGNPDAKRASSAKGKLAEDIRRRFAVFGGFDFEPLRRDAMRRIPGFRERSSPTNS